MPKIKDRSSAQPVININTSAPASSPETEKPEIPKEEKPINWFFTDLAEKPAHEWGKVWSLELHRLKPDVPGVPGTKGYLRIFTEPVTLETIRTNFGGGRFRLNLCKNGRWHTSHEFEIEGQPIYDVSRERPQANSNGNAAIGADLQKEFIGVLREELQRSRDGQAPGGEEVIKMLTSASEKAMEIVTRQSIPATDPAAQLNSLLSSAKTLADLRAPQSGGLGDLGQLLIPVLKPLLERLITPPDPLGDLTKLAGLMDVLEKIRGGGNDAPPKDWRAAAVQAVTSHLPEILDTFKTTSANAAVANQSRARAAELIRGVPPQQQVAAAARTAPQATAPQEMAAPPLATASGGGLRLVPRDSIDEAPAAQPAAETAQAQPMSVDEHRQALKINVVNLFLHGASGSSIASYVEDVDPEFAADFARYTTDQIIDFFSTDPVLKMLVESNMPHDPEFPTRLHEVLADAREFMKEADPLPVN